MSYGMHVVCAECGRNYGKHFGLSCIVGGPTSFRPVGIEAASVPRGVEEEKAAEETSTAKSPLQTLRELVEIKGRDGTWNHDDYMLGLFNGLELAFATMEGRDPQYRTLKAPQASTPASTAKPAPAGISSLPDGVETFVPFRFGSADLLK